MNENLQSGVWYFFSERQINLFVEVVEKDLQALVGRGVTVVI